MFTNALGYGQASREVGNSYLKSRQDVVTVKTQPLKDALCLQVKTVGAERRCRDGRPARLDCEQL